MLEDELRAGLVPAFHGKIPFPHEAMGEKYPP